MATAGTLRARPTGPSTPDPETRCGPGPNSGLSSRRRRSQNTARASGTAARNGSRQPHCSSCARVSTSWTRRPQRSPRPFRRRAGQVQPAVETPTLRRRLLEQVRHRRAGLSAVPKAWTIRRPARAATAKSPAFAAEGNSPTAGRRRARGQRHRPGTAGDDRPVGEVADQHRTDGTDQQRPAKPRAPTSTRPGGRRVTTTPSKAAEAPKVAKSVPLRQVAQRSGGTVRRARIVGTTTLITDPPTLATRGIHRSLHP
jgi:hypothetical protein